MFNIKIHCAFYTIFFFLLQCFCYSFALNQMYPIKLLQEVKMEKRVFLIVLDSFGVGAEPDAEAFGDEGTNFIHCCSHRGCRRHKNAD